jgi:DNA repair protein RecN (Recombination protein N)
MLASLTVRDVVLIEKAELNFAPGLNVLTGETGAGKSILLDALGLAAGGRGQGRGVLRPGAEQAVAIAVFKVDSRHPSRALLAENDLDADEIILRRTVSADGRTRAFVNDAAIGAQLARGIGESLIEVHGQVDDRGLFDASTHRRLLDAYGGHEDLTEATARHFELFKAALLRHDEMVRARDTAAQEIDFLKHAAAELSGLSPEPGEEAALASERALLMNAERLAKDVGEAAHSVSGEGGAQAGLASALRRLSRLPKEGRDAAAKAEAALDSALILVEEGARELAALLSRLDGEPGKLTQVEERLFDLRDAARKYGVPSERLPQLGAEFEAKLAALGGGAGSLAAQEAEVARGKAAYLASAHALSAARAAAAKRLEAAVFGELKPLKLGGARFRVALTPLDLTEAGVNGLERVGFEIATVEGAPFGPLAKIASGGELARFALAFKVALAEASPPAVMVFDEVDRGVGGAVAAAVGERLQRLARTTQVLLVTHSPQVAARARRHFRITRHRDSTRVEELDEESRVEEIARMLSGAAVTEEARAAARRLIVEAADSPPPKKRARA